MLTVCYNDNKLTKSHVFDVQDGVQGSQHRSHLLVDIRGRGWLFQHCPRHGSNEVPEMQEAKRCYLYRLKWVHERPGEPGCREVDEADLSR